MPWLSLIAIAGGAVLGAWARWALMLWLDHAESTFKWGLLTANWLGAFVIGFIVIVLSKSAYSPLWRLFWITGLLGSLTTFSSFSLHIVDLLSEQHLKSAMLSVLLHVIGAVVLTLAGMWTANQVL